MSDRLNEIEERLAAATPVAPGHWRLDTNGTPHIVDIRREKPMSLLVIHDEPNGPESARPDAELIAHAPADLAALVAVVREVEALHPMRTAVRGTHGDICGACSTPWPCPTAAALQRLGGA